MLMQQIEYGPKRSSIGLCLSLLLACVFMITLALSHGLPITYLADERNQIYYFAHLGSTLGSQEHFLYGFWPMAVHTAAYAFMYGVLHICGVVESVAEYKLLFLTTETPFLVVSRIINTLYATICLYVIYKLGDRIGGRRVGWMALLLSLISAEMLWQFTYINVDVPTLLCVLLGALFTLRMYDADAGRAYIWAAVAIGLGCAAKYYPAIYVPLLLVTIIRTSRSRREALHRSAIAVTVVLGVFVATMPSILLDYHRFYEGFTKHLWVQYNWRYAYVAWDGPRWQYYLCAVLPWYMSAATGVLWCLDAVISVAKRDRKHLTCHAFGVLGFILVAMHPNIGVRFFLPVAPFLIIGACSAIFRIVDRARSQYARVLACSGCLLITCVPIGLATLQDVCNCFREDTREAARRWIEGHIPENSRLARESHWAGGGLHQGNPQLLSGKKKVRIRQLWEEVRGVRDSEELRQILKRPAYDIINVQYRSPEMLVSLKRDVDYYVVSSHAYETFIDRSSIFPEEAAFYNGVFKDKEFHEVVRFDESHGLRSGPTIIIYAIKAAGQAVSGNGSN